MTEVVIASSLIRFVQCALMTRIASGFGNRVAIRCQASLHSVSSKAFSGEPWPMKIAGIRFVSDISFSVHFVPLYFPTSVGKTPVLR